ncbi:hypothetical protein [Streptomyces sp. AS02]|uniref:hypothetical protein n=1 Tax=Streptomyces sp. AS02 TaxID=2938946 RepID=UPI0020226AAD|nr:hypothetical protein [Streptomyces sp. AS02]MCL8016878.1 hypothetical protein [Streptomyces sp. AS02]
MRRTAATATAVLASLLLAAGCSSGDGDEKTDTKPSPTRLSTKWGPKLEAVTDADKAVCNAVGDQACAEHLTDIALAVGDLERAVNAAGGSARYPRTMTEIGKVNAAVEAYTDHECLGDENAGITGSPCPDDAQTILTGGKTLTLALQADEAA